MNKKINFQIYRYHLLTLSNKSQQINMFPGKEISANDLRKQKNIFFKEVLDNILPESTPSNPIKVHHQEDEFYLFKVANKKITSITKNFKTTNIDNEPYVYVILNNNKKVQKIAISDNIEAFSSPDVVKNVLLKIFQRDLKKHGLNIQIEPLFHAGDFWEFAERYKSQITKVDFRFVKPNLAEISDTLPEAFKRFVDITNGHESNIILKAPKNGILENIDKSNNAVEGLVEYSSEGGGNIKMKVKNLRKELNTKEKPVILTIEEIDIEGAAEQVIKLYQTIINE